jgi:hypothetical protein
LELVELVVTDIDVLADDADDVDEVEKVDVVEDGVRA